jgi:predicted metal-dependent hydrolase
MSGPETKYRIQTSPRGRNVCLKLSQRDGLTVVVPRGFDLRRIPAILERKRRWIETHLQQFVGISEAISPVPVVTLPEAIELPALGESWLIEYQPVKIRRIGIMMEKPWRLTVYGAVADLGACRAVLVQWLKRRTREELVPWLSRLAGENGFRFSEVLIRGQKTRWASCSSKGTISLSYKLLFLDRDSVRCILLHELCHTVLMNHSRRFWTLLGGLEPDCMAIRKRMRGGWKQVPSWVEGLTEMRLLGKGPA